MRKVDELVLNKDLKLVQVWEVDYGDGDNEELEEKELRRYRFPHPILPIPLGASFNVSNCTEVSTFQLCVILLAIKVVRGIGTISGASLEGCID